MLVETWLVGRLRWSGEHRGAQVCRVCVLYSAARTPHRPEMGAGRDAGVGSGALRDRTEHRSEQRAPAATRLAALPLKLVDGALTVAGGFTGPVGFQNR